MKIKMLLAQNKTDWALAGHSKLLGDFSQLETVVASGMSGKINMKIIEVDLDSKEVLSIEEYKGE